MPPAPRIALILSGGGARAAYQAGVARAIAEFVPAGSASPFAIICGTSAGAINAASLAAGARDFRRAATTLCGAVVEAHASATSIAPTPRTCCRRPGASCVRCCRAPTASAWSGFLDNAPLAKLLERELHFPSIEQSIAAGALEALTITASSYQSGMSVSFCMGGPTMELWERSQRIGVRAAIGVPHLLASSAIPFVFPPTRIGERILRRRRDAADGADRARAASGRRSHPGSRRGAHRHAHRAR